MYFLRFNTGGGDNNRPIRDVYTDKLRGAVGAGTNAAIRSALRPGHALFARRRGWFFSATTGRGVCNKRPTKKRDDTQRHNYIVHVCMYVRIYCTTYLSGRHCVVRPGVKTPRTHYALCEGMCGSKAAAVAVVRSRFHISSKVNGSILLCLYSRRTIPLQVYWCT